MRHPLLTVFPTLSLILAMPFTGSSLAQTQTVLWPSAMHLFSISVPPGWGTTQTDDGVSFQIYPPDKTCSVVASYLKNAQLAGRSTSDMATEIGAKAGLGQFADAGPAVISGVKGEAFSATQPDPSGGGLWIVRLIFVPLEPGLWAGEFVKWPQSATPAQQAACNAGAEAVTLIKH